MTDYTPFLVSALRRGIEYADKTSPQFVDTNLSYFRAGAEDGDFHVALYSLAQNIVHKDQSRMAEYASGLVTLARNMPEINSTMLCKALETAFAGRPEYRDVQDLTRLVAVAAKAKPAPACAL